jgi:single-strand DNA-binding protein
MNINKVFIFGNVTRDIELRATPSGRSVANFTVATNRVYYDQNRQKQQETEFHNVVVWGRLAELVSQYLTKGRSVFVEGYLRTRRWEDSNGLRHSRTEIIAQNIQFGPRLAGAVPAERIAEPEPEPETIPEVQIEDNIPIEEGELSVFEGEDDLDKIPF